MTSRFVTALGSLLIAAASLTGAAADDDVGQHAGQDAGNISGAVKSASGPESGVWVIAETSDLGAKFAKIVVTDDSGRFLLPELPSANYQVWVRGYGLADSPQTRARPGDELKLEVQAAATPQEAAQIYPASYWFSLLRVPPASDFPGTDANGIAPEIRSQAEWIGALKGRCLLCHQLGDKATREFPMLDRDKFDSAADAWASRLAHSWMGPTMVERLASLGYTRAVQEFAHWTDRIRAGQTPPQPPRPRGKERNVVLTMWEWGVPQGALHDSISTDKRNPTLYPNGRIYGVGLDGLVILDPLTHTVRQLDLPHRNPAQDDCESWAAASSLYWGTQGVRTNFRCAHNPMLDDKGRLWITQAVRAGRQTADWCRKGSSHPSAKYFPIEENTEGRHVSYYVTETGRFELIETCFGTHHLQFDADDRLWFSGEPDVIGWLDTRHYDDSGDERASQGWCPTVIDTNGDGKITRPWNEPGASIDPTKDTRISSKNYGIIPNPKDGSIWTARPGTPGSLVRLNPGNEPPQTCITEVFEPPFGNPSAGSKTWGFFPRGIDIDANGLLWTALAGSNHIASFDRGKCKVLNGPSAVGQHCAEGWTLYPTAGPKLTGDTTTSATADLHYYIWVDQFDTLGLGKNIPIANGTNDDSLIALIPQTGEQIVMRVPYPLGFYTRGLDGRIDDPKEGWKGRGVWASYDQFNWHLEGGKGSKGAVVKFQLRPDPLAE